MDGADRRRVEPKDNRTEAGRETSGVAELTAPTLVEQLRTRAERYRDKTAFVVSHDGEAKDSHRLSYRELDTAARRIGARLQQQGATGEPVLVLCPPGLDFIVGFFGCLYAGAIAVPVHPPLREHLIPRVNAIVADVQPRFALTTAAAHAKIETTLERLVDGPALRWSVTDADIDDDRPWARPNIDAETVAMVQYTSGSTSTPKGVVLSHGNLAHNLEAIRRAWRSGFDTSATGVFWLPPYHDMGLIGGLLETLYVGGASVLMPPNAFIKRPMRWLEAISRHRAVISAAPNFAYDLCVELSSAEQRAALDLSNWSTVMCGAEPVRTATLRGFADAFAPAGFRPQAFLPVYGLAEATLLVSGGSDSPTPTVMHLDRAALGEHRVVEREPGHPSAAALVGCGRPRGDQRVVVVDPATSRPCRPGEVGELWIGGPSVAQGYWGRPELSAETFSARLAETGDGPFLRTGDLGFAHAGELFVTGRCKDLIIIRGINHYPNDIELSVQDRHPALLPGRGAVFSIAPQPGDVEELVVVQEIDQNRAGAAKLDEIVQAIRTVVTENHDIRAHAVVLVEPLGLPTTSSGKIQRGACRQRFIDDELTAVAAWRAPKPRAPQPNAGPDAEAAAPKTDSNGGRRNRRGAAEIADWLVAHLCEELELSAAEIDRSRPLACYGLDSVHAVRLTSALEAWLGGELSPTLVYEHPTIDALSRHLARAGRRRAGDAPAGEPADAPESAAQTPESAAATATSAADDPIAIIGIGCRFPGADGPAAFWRLLADGVDAITEVPSNRWDTDAFYDPDPAAPGTAVSRWGGFLSQVDRFDFAFFGISPRESAQMDPQQRLLLEVAWEALEDAGQVPERLAGSRAGVFVGISTSDYGQRLAGRPELVDAYTGTGNALSIAANRLSYVFDLHGPSLAVDTACSSSLVAVDLACRSLRDGESSLAIAGGVNVILSPALAINFTKAKVMAPDGHCKTFDAAADGYVRGEGAGVVVLKPLSRALADNDPIYAVIRGTATGQDGRTNGLIAPNRRSQEAVLAAAYRRAGVPAGAVHYVEAHGTGTFLGDAIEADALGAVLAPGRPDGDRCLIGSVKTNIGHLEAAAGIAGLIKVALALQHRKIPPSLNFTEPNPHIHLDDLALDVVASLTSWPKTGGRATAGVSSFGFGGTNAHAVLTEAPQVRVAPTADTAVTGRAELLALSARSPAALAALAGEYATTLARGAALTDLCYTAGARRGHHAHRLCAVGDSPAAMAESLSAHRTGQVRAGLVVGDGRVGNPAAVVFVFSGQGSQWTGMGRRLQSQEPVFHDAMAACDQALQPHLGTSILAELATETGGSGLGGIGVIQPAIFAVQVALAALWRSWGIEPAAVIGHSLGEVAAAHIAGALGLDDAARVICARARLLRWMRGHGAMMVAEVTDAEARELIGGRERQIAIAANNSHRSTVLSGEPTALADVMALLGRRDRFCRWINVDVAAHSPRVGGLSVDLREALAGLTPTAPTIPMYSTVTGDVLTDRLPDADYWVDNLCLPVRFSTAVRRLLDRGHDTVVEISPHPLLSAAVREDAADLGVGGTSLPSMRRDDGGRETALASLGALYTQGQSIAWERLYPTDSRCITAPTYPWQRLHSWLETEAITAAPRRDAIATKPAAGALPWRGPFSPAARPQTVLTELDIDVESMPALNDHRVDGLAVLPAALLLRLVAAGADRALETDAHTLRDIEFHRPLELSGTEPHTVQLAFDQNPAGAVSFECYAAEPGTDGPRPWVRLAGGAVAAGVPAGGDPPHRMDAARARCTQAISGATLYELLADHGLHYGPKFRVVDNIWHRDGEAVAELAPAMPAQPAGDTGDAAVLDGCFQTLAAALCFPRDSGPPAIYLPAGLAELSIPGALAEGTWAHAVERVGPDPEPDVVTGDVFLARPDGQTVAAVRGLRLQRIPTGRSTTPATNPRDRTYRPRWRPESARPEPETADRAGDAGGWLVFGDGGATTDTLRDHLESRGETCVLVEPDTSPGDFRRLAPDSYRLDPTRPEHFRRLFDEAFTGQAPPCRGVVHLWSLRAAPPTDTSAETLESATTLGAVSVLHLVQALASTDRTDPPRLWLVTSGAQTVGADAGPVSIAQAPVWGMGRSIDHEHPELRCSRVDLSIGGGPEELRALLAELWADNRDTDVALRGHRRYVARLARFDDHADDPPPPSTPPAPGDDVVFRMQSSGTGGLDDVRALTETRRPPGLDEVELRVYAVGLNFIDVLRTLGIYPGQDDAPVRVGIECAGTVTAVGDNVDRWRIGDAVVGLAADGIGAFVTTHARLVVAKPPRLSFTEAASMPIAYLTAHYALCEQARLRGGERVLIHSAAGGVGLAAVHLARRLGAAVYATAGTTAKRDHLRALGVDYAGDSRSLAFGDEVLAATGGDGVDVVLNSLTGEAIAAGLAAMGPYGRLVEIGKRDIYQHGRLRLWQLRRNASYVVVDLARLVTDRPAYVGDLLTTIMAEADAGQLPPLPIRTFPTAETVDALRCLARGDQIGKVVVCVHGNPPSTVEPAKPANGPAGGTVITADATYLITGGLGALGRLVATWMAEHGARHLVLMGRGPATPPARETIEALEATGVEVRIARGDVTNANDVVVVVESIGESMPPLRGVIHAAGILDDAVVAHLDDSRLRTVMAPKVAGAWNLHALTADAALDFFVLFSSAASLLGSPGQANYAAANAFLDALAWHRRAEGRPALSINWGPWAGLGLSTSSALTGHLTGHGVAAMTATDCLQALSYLLARPATQVGVADIDWARWHAGLSSESSRSFGAELHDEPGDDAPELGKREFCDVLSAAASSQRHEMLESYLCDLIAEKLGLTPAQLDVDSPLINLGVDSLITLELRTQIERDLGVVVPVARLLAGPSVAGLAGWLTGQLPNAAGGTHAPPDETRPHETGPDTADGGAAVGEADLLGRVPELSDAAVDELLRSVVAERALAGRGNGDDR